MIMNVEYSKIKKAVPILLFLFVFSLVIDNSFKLISVAIADDLNISVTTVSWQATLAGLVIGIGAVVYASLSDAISIRTLFIYGVILIIIGSIIGYIFQHQFALLLVGRIIQTAGLAAAETLYMIGALIAIIVFALYIKNAQRPLVNKSFFQNKRYASFLFIVFVMYAIQLGYIFTFPFIMEQIYHLQLDTTSLLLVPGYIVAVIVGALSGKIGEYLNSKQAIITAIILIALSLILPAFAVGNHISIFVISMIFFAGSFALMYAPLLNEAIKTIDLNMTGVAIGFYNLIINVAVSVGIAIAAALIDFKALNFPGNDALSSHFGIILIILGLMSIVGLVLFVILNRWTQSEK